MFLVDIDGVCLDMLSALKERLPSFRPENVESYGFDGDIGVSKYDVYECLNEPLTYSLEKPYEGVVKTLYHLYDSGVNVQYWTSVIPEVYSIRKSQASAIGLNVGMIYEKDVVKSETSYFESIRRLGINQQKVTAVIDDNPEELLPLTGKDVVLFLRDQVYNRGFEADGIIRVSGLPEAAEIFLRMRDGGTE